jgi:hypothetical protein
MYFSIVLLAIICSVLGEPTNQSNHSNNTSVVYSDGFYLEYGMCVVCPLHHICRNQTRTSVSVFDTGLRTLNTGTVLLQDAVCAPGMFRTSLLDLCKPCPRNFFCPSGRQIGLPNVVRCVDNQLTYTTGVVSITECVCKAGFKISNYNQPGFIFCLEYDEGERCQDGTVVETFCHIQNKVPNANHDECVCREGFFMLNFE